MTPVRASFNCNLARTQVAQLICADPKLGSLDQQMASLYAQKRRAQPGSGEEQNRAGLPEIESLAGRGPAINTGRPS